MLGLAHLLMGFVIGFILAISTDSLTSGVLSSLIGLLGGGGTVLVVRAELRSSDALETPLTAGALLGLGAGLITGLLVGIVWAVEAGIRLPAAPLA